MLGCRSFKAPKAEELRKLLWDLYLDEDSLISKQFKEADGVNKKSSATSSYAGSLSYTTHAQAVYTSRLLDFKNLPEPKNADEYSGN